jgi:DUF1680 family protein
LPNETAYAETCASIALVFFAQRMFQLEPNARYIDVMERALYNGVLSGVSYDGTHFFYANPLAAYPKVNPHDPWSAVKTDPHYRREEWFLCPCCPPNLARLVASIGSYFYSVAGETIYVNLYDSNRSDIEVSGRTVRLEQQTDYPWDETIRLAVKVEQPTYFTLALRIPGWCRDARVQVNGQDVALNSEHGYARISREWTSGDSVTLTLAMPVERMLAHPKVRQDAGKIALQRGPVVYCLEEVDNGADLANVSLPRDTPLTAGFDPQLFGGVSVITGSAKRYTPRVWNGSLYQPQSTTVMDSTEFTFKAIPYFLWANRAPGEMRVWIRED